MRVVASSYISVEGAVWAYTSVVRVVGVVVVGIHGSPPNLDEVADCASVMFFSETFASRGVVYAFH